MSASAGASSNSRVALIQSSGREDKEEEEEWVKMKGGQSKR